MTYVSKEQLFYDETTSQHDQRISLRYLDPPETFPVSMSLMFPLYFLDIFLTTEGTKLG
jgi:hypothetical protein